MRVSDLTSEEAHYLLQAFEYMLNCGTCLEHRQSQFYAANAIKLLKKLEEKPWT